MDMNNQKIKNHPPSLVFFRKQIEIEVGQFLDIKKMFSMEMSVNDMQCNNNF